MVGRLPPPPLVRADMHCLQTSPAPSDLHCHCCAAAAFLVAPPLPLSPRRCYLPCHAAAAAFLAARPPLPSSPRGRRCLPCRAATAAFLAMRPPLPSCLPCRAAADPSRLEKLRPSVPPPAHPSDASPDAILVGCRHHCRAAADALPLHYRRRQCAPPSRVPPPPRCCPPPPRC